MDHDERRRELAEAVWQVVRRDGVEGASVRAVAREAGWSPGALRHYFPTQSDLLAAAMRAVVDRIDTRLGSFRTTGAAAEVPGTLLQLLPPDAERRAENEVWLAFTLRALVDDDLRQLHRDVDRMLLAVCRWAIKTLAAARGGGDRWDVALESARLHALMDGLAVHAALAPPGAVARRPAHLSAVLGRHLASL